MTDLINDTITFSKSAYDFSISLNEYAIPIAVLIILIIMGWMIYKFMKSHS